MKRRWPGIRFPYRWNPDAPSARRPAAARRQGGRHRLVRRRPLLRLPPRQRLRRAGRHGGPRRRASTTRCSPDSTAGPRLAASGFERWTIDPAARSVDAQVDRPRAARIPAPGRAPLRPALSLRLYDGAAPGTLPSARPAASSTTSRPASGRSTTSARAGIRASSCSCRANADAAEDDGWLIGLVIDTDGRDDRPRHPRRAQLRSRPASQRSDPAPHPAGLPRQLDTERALIVRATSCSRSAFSASAASLCDRTHGAQPEFARQSHRLRPWRNRHRSWLGPPRKAGSTM